MTNLDFPLSSQFFFNSSKGKIHYRWYKTIPEENAPILCCLPGYSFPASLYHSFAIKLQNMGNSVIVVDYWGRGHSSAQKENDYSLESNKNLVISLLDHLKITKCSFVGFSYGCAVAALIAHTRIELVNKIILCSPFHCNGEPMSPLQQFILSAPFVGPWIFKATAKNNIQKNLNEQIYDSENKEELINQIVQHCTQHSIQRAVDLSSSVASFDLMDVEKAIAGLSDINKQILVICGKEDHIIDVEQCQTWWSHWISNADFTLVENSGHLIFIDQPDFAAEQIQNFIKKTNENP